MTTAEQRSIEDRFQAWLDRQGKRYRHGVPRAQQLHDYALALLRGDA